ncbi:retinol dehydrogenase 12-like isoform X2 [Frankliniella occidentalis]|uniref:Retinol dehydrogenase 12-like isoform X2 n=1 Tax=Frankliniella occidentalis TaxID=133901 RepID=A0A6J1S5Z8_FRAOC|nr:retinol dehydrogenase 12-like isoform X2 [Frankliniella occidentalis]
MVTTHLRVCSSSQLLLVCSCRVVLAVRDTAKGERAAADIRKKLSSKRRANLAVGEVTVEHLDLASLKSVRACALRLLNSEEPAIHILINNAGVMACPKAYTEDGHDLQFGVNHLGHFLLTTLLLPRLRASAGTTADGEPDPARVVNVSSVAYSFSRIDFEDLRFEHGYRPLLAYSRSKLANMLFTRELANRLKEHSTPGVTSYCVHPGVVATELFEHFDTFIIPGTKFFLDNVGRFFIKTPRQGAQTSLYCAVSRTAAHQSGLYYVDCSVSTPFAIGRDDEAAKRLWDVSCELVGLRGYDPLGTEDPPTSLFT